MPKPISAILPERFSDPLAVSPDVSVASSDRYVNAVAADFADIMNVLEGISYEIHTNLKFTKAIYRGTKKSLTGAGNEVARLHPDEGPGSQQLAGRGRSSERLDRLSAIGRSSERLDVDGHRGTDRYRSPGRHRSTDRPRVRSSDRLSDDGDVDQERVERHRGADRYRNMDRNRGSHDSEKSMPTASSGLVLSSIGISDTSSWHAKVPGEGPPNLIANIETCGGKLEETAPAHDNAPDVVCSPPCRTSAGSPARDIKKGGTSSTITSILMQHQTLQNRTSVKIWRFMEDPSSGRAAYVYFLVRILLLAFSVIAACVQFFDDKLTLDTNMTWMQLVFEVWYASELIVRLCVSSDRIAFVCSGFNFIDFLSACPASLRIYVLISAADSAAIRALFGVVPVWRLLKFLRHFDTFQLLWSAFFTAAEALPMLLFTLFLIASTFAALIFYAEPRTSIPSMPLALYFAIVTVSTVGYGDFAPVSGAGKIFSCMLAVIGPMYMAIPIGIIGHAFSQVWEDRQRLLMLHQMRSCVKNIGYTEKELRRMFELIDRNGDGTLDMEEFVSWISVLEIRMPDHIIAQVFESFDADDEGSIDFQELLRGLYPRAKFGLRRLQQSVATVRESLGSNRRSR